MAINKVLGKRLSRAALENVRETWRAEKFTDDMNNPRLADQQYVLFDEYEVWPSGDGWP